MFFVENKIDRKSVKLVKYLDFYNKSVSELKIVLSQAKKCRQRRSVCIGTVY